MKKYEYIQVWLNQSEVHGFQEKLNEYAAAGWRFFGRYPNNSLIFERELPIEISHKITGSVGELGRMKKPDPNDEPRRQLVNLEMQIEELQDQVGRQAALIAQKNSALDWCIGYISVDRGGTAGVYAPKHVVRAREAGE